MRYTTLYWVELKKNSVGETLRGPSARVQERVPHPGTPEWGGVGDKIDFRTTRNCEAAFLNRPQARQTLL